MTYSLGEAAKATGKSKMTIQRAIKNHVIAGIKDGFSIQTKLAKAKTKLQDEMKEQKVLEQANIKKALKSPSYGTGSAMRLGYFVNWDDASFYSLKTNLDVLDAVA